MGTYQVAEVCPNGHVSASSADVNPELREKLSQIGNDLTELTKDSPKTQVASLRFRKRPVES